MVLAIVGDISGEKILIGGSMKFTFTILTCDISTKYKIGFVNELESFGYCEVTNI